MGRVATLTTYIFFNPFILFAFSTAAPSKDCVYMIYVKTGLSSNAGNASKISLSFYDSKLSGIRFNNIKTWGSQIMGSNYNYFQPGGLDMFCGRGPCLNRPVCQLNLTSDGSGNGGWFCDHVEVTSTGVNKPCAKHFFNVNKWLSPVKSLEVIKDECPSAAAEETVAGKSWRDIHHSPCVVDAKYVNPSS